MPNPYVLSAPQVTRETEVSGLFLFQKGEARQGKGAERNLFCLARHLLWELCSSQPSPPGSCLPAGAGPLALPSQGSKGRHSRLGPPAALFEGSGQTTVPQWGRYQGWAQLAQGPSLAGAGQGQSGLCQQSPAGREEGPGACGGRGEGAATRRSLVHGLLRAGAAGWPREEGPEPGFSWAPTRRYQHPSPGRALAGKGAQGAGITKGLDTRLFSPGLRGIKRTWSPTLLPLPAPGAPQG